MKYLLTLLFFNVTLLNAQNSGVWGHLSEGSRITFFLRERVTKPITPDIQEAMSKRLDGFSLHDSKENNVQIGNRVLHFETSPSTHLYKSNDGSASLFIREIQNRQHLDSAWVSFSKLKGTYSGFNYQRSAFFYLKLDTLFNVSINATFKTDKHIINVQKRIPIYSTDIDAITDAQWIQIDEANVYLLGILQILCEQLTYDKDKIFFPSNGRLYHRVFTAAERLAGFVQFWTEVKYNFAFFGHVPELDWDQTLLEYLPRIQADQSNAEYYKLMTELCAKLNDGHTNVYPPSDLWSDNYYPNVELGHFDGGIYILNTSEKYRRLLPIGSEIVQVDGEKITDYLHNKLYPYISASTGYIKQKIAIQNLMEIPADKKLTLEFIDPKGMRGKYEFSFETDTTSWIITQPESYPVEFERLKNKVAYLKLNTFKNDQVVTEFLKFKDSIGSAEKLIIDLRENSGGNSTVGYEILKYFSPKPFLTSKWMTREHKAAYKAWANTSTDTPTDEFDAECLLTARGDFWHVAPPDTIDPYLDKIIAIPIVILIGNNTASAAEDFLIAADNIGLTETVGDLTFGSTGQPLFIQLPGGGSARICTKKDTYPDGKEFVGYGIQPKYMVKPTLKDALNHRDTVLEFALGL